MLRAGHPPIPGGPTRDRAPSMRVSGSSQYDSRNMMLMRGPNGQAVTGGQPGTLTGGLSWECRPRRVLSHVATGGGPEDWLRTASLVGSSAPPELWPNCHDEAWSQRTVTMVGCTAGGDYVPTMARIAAAVAGPSTGSVVSTSTSLPPASCSGVVVATRRAMLSRRAGLITSRWMGWRAPVALTRTRSAAISGSHRQNTSVQPPNSRRARSRRSRRHQPSQTTPGVDAARRNSTSAAASPMRSDQLSSPKPSESPSASLMTSRLKTGTLNWCASSSATVVLPVPGAPDTTTRSSTLRMMPQLTWTGVRS
jgi:hypothetical protein